MGFFAVTVVLKIGRCLAAMRGGAGYRGEWGVGSIHKAFPFASMVFFLVTVLSCGPGILVTHVPVSMYGSMRVANFRNRGAQPKFATRSNDEKAGGC